MYGCMYDCDCIHDFTEALAGKMLQLSKEFHVFVKSP